MEDGAILLKNKNIVSRVIGDETVLLPIYKSSDEIDCIYTLNKAAAWIWEKIDGRRSIAALKEEVSRAFDVTPQKRDSLMKELLKDLKEINAILVKR
jgi:hypothetical protein